MVKTGSEALLSWAQLKTKGYQDVNIQNFTSSWLDGLAFCALIHKYHPKLVAFPLLKKKDKDKNLELAFSRAAEVGIPRLITKEDVEQGNEVSIMQYVARYYFVLEVKEKDCTRKKVDSIYLEEESDRPKKSVKVAALGAKIKLNPAMMNPATAAQAQQEKEKAKEEEKANEEPAKLQHLTANRAAPPKRKPPAKARGRPQQQKKTIGPSEPRASQSEDLDDTEDSQSYSYLFSKTQPNAGQKEPEKQQQVETAPQQQAQQQPETTTQQTASTPEQKPRTETANRPKPVAPPRPAHLSTEIKQSQSTETQQQTTETKPAEPITTTQQTETQATTTQQTETTATETQQSETKPAESTTTQQAETQTTQQSEEPQTSDANKPAVPPKPSGSDLSFLLDDLKQRRAASVRLQQEQAATQTQKTESETQSTDEKPEEAPSQQTVTTTPEQTSTAQTTQETQKPVEQPAQKPAEPAPAAQNPPLQKSKSSESSPILGVFIAIPSISFSQLMKIDRNMNTGDLRDLLIGQYADRLPDIYFFDLAIMSGQDEANWLNYEISIQQNKITESSTVVFVDKREFEQTEPEQEEKEKEDPPPVNVEGFLIKEVKTTLKSSRKRRWFISQENRLCYYKDKKDPDPIGVINLTKDTEVVKVGTATFLIKTPTRAFQLVANSADDMNQWVNGLTAIINFYKNKTTSTFKEGYLQKSDPKGNNWKNRLFVLRTDFLYYYEVSDKGLYHKGKCPLYQGKVETSKLSNKERKWVFQLATKERTFFMAAPTQEERSEWMDAIQKRIDQVNKSIDSITID